MNNYDLTYQKKKALAIMVVAYGPRREKTCLRGFQQSEFRTSLLSYGDYLENLNFACSKS